MSTVVLSTGDKILNLMKEMDMSIPGLAALSGIRENTLLNVMAGICEPDISTACKIADALGVCVRELCPDEEQYSVPVDKNTLAKLIVVSEMNGVELSDLIASILEKGMEDSVYLLPGEKAEQIDTNGMYKQLDLFSLFTEQVGSLAMKQAEQGNVQTEQASPGQLKAALPKEQLDTILRSGGGMENSRKRIYAKYQQGKTPEEMAAFLKKEYGTTGKGFEFDGKQIAVWFDGQGMSVGHGTSAQEHPVLQMDWQEIEAQIRSQVESGAYMGANEAYLVDEVERGRIATFAAYFFYDGIGEMPEELLEKIGNRSDAHEKMVELLSSPEGIDLVTSHMDKALAQLESGEKKLRFRSVMPKEELRAELDNLLLAKKAFPTADHVEVKKEDFITQDEIDHRLGRGSGFEHGSFRIYDYYMEGHDSKETANFLKHEYGTGGSSDALAGNDQSWEDHNSKGIRLEKGSIMKPYTEVLLPWKAVEKRIRKLIEEDKYLSPKGKEAYAEYKVEQAQKELEKAQAKMERDTKISCKGAIERTIAEKFDGRRLPKDTAEEVIKEYGMMSRSQSQNTQNRRKWRRQINPTPSISRSQTIPPALVRQEQAFPRKRNSSGMWKQSAHWKRSRAKTALLRRRNRRF